MRTPLVAGNWKMNKTVELTRSLLAEMVPDLKSVMGVEKVVCPPYTSLLAASAMLTGTDIGLGAQDLYWEPSGAYTGEISPQMVAELCRYVIIGHSERRTYFGETDETVNRKTKAALANYLIPIVCVGETLAQYEANETAEVVTHQIREGLKDLDREQTGRIVIAYEPVWAIGTGRAATAEGANQVIAGVIRAALHEMYGQKMAEATRVLYGGSVTAANAAEFFGMPDIDGALVGGASLKAPDFLTITKAAKKPSY
ncbi:MAG TPA: triose-phosphate isomerase [Anaerolineaceae bacterium]|nr:triose-phosphate isomerase [Anaerolineaceae bacterium]